VIATFRCEEPERESVFGAESARCDILSSKPIPKYYQTKALAQKRPWKQIGSPHLSTCLSLHNIYYMLLC
jgi:hypothetical protein